MRKYAEKETKALRARPRAGGRGLVLTEGRNSKQLRKWNLLLL